MQTVLSREQIIILELIKNGINIFWVGNDIYVERGTVKVRYPKFNFDFMDIELLIKDIIEATEPSRKSLIMKHKHKKKKGKCGGNLIYSTSIHSKNTYTISVSEKKKNIRKNLILKGIIYNF